MTDDHKTRTIEYAHERFIEFECGQYRKWLNTNKVPEKKRKAYENMWSRLMQNGADTFFLEETTVPDDEIDYELVNFFIWIYGRDGWTTFRPYWQILGLTWRNYKAMGLDLYFERTEDYRVGN